MTTNYNVLNDCRGMYEEEIFETVLKSRQVENPEHFLNPCEDDLLPLDALKNIDIAYRELNDVMDSSGNIGIHFDVDTDGITSGTIITRYLCNLTDKKNVKVFINDGKKHGLKSLNLDKFNGLNLLIVVDSLDSDVKQYKRLKEKGIKVVVLDHHVVKNEIQYDKYITLVSSQVCYENKALSGAGVVWKFCKYLDQQYMTDYADTLTDLAACGLIADMMDMTIMENRYIVSKGLEKIYNPAIKKIVGGFEFNSTAISFSVAPLINAANRMGQNELAMNTFLADDNKEVLKCVKELKKCKEQQNKEVLSLMPNVLMQCENQASKKMIVALIDTPHGISGLIANKLLEKYQRPILVLKDNDEAFAGSMRAVGVDDFREICNKSSLAKADGHELASGIEIMKVNYNKFVEFIDKNLPQLKTDFSVDVDIRINIGDLTRKLVDKIKAIDRISGERFKPVKVFIDGIDDYEVGQMSDYKHLVIKPNDYTNIIKWNFMGSFDDMKESSIMSDELQIVCNLDSGFFGKNFVLKAICDEIRVVS